MRNKPQYLYQVSDGKPNETPIYVNPKSKNGLLPPKEHLRNLQEQILESFKHFENKQTLGIYNEETEKYDHIAYKDILEISTAIGSSLCMEESIKEICDQQGNIIKPVGIHMSNCREWTFADIACILYGFTTCPFYETLGPQNLTSSMNMTQISLCFVEKNTAKFIAQSEIPQLKTIITIDEIDQETANILKNKNIQIISFNQFLIRGRANPKPYPQISPEQAFTLVFTSGSTGQPKAVVWRHLNFACQLASTFETDDQLILTEDDVIFQHIPMPHTSEKLLHLQALLKGALINFSSGDFSKLLQDMRRCKPTYMVTVPSVFNTIYDDIIKWLNQQTPEFRELFFQAVQQKIQSLQSDQINEEYDNFFQQTRAIIGGRQRILNTFAAPISKKVLDFLKVTLCCQINEEYGQTEIGCALLTSSADKTSGHVGGPSISHELKLVSVPEMNCYTDASVNGKVRGEIYIRGQSVINSYWANPTYSAETFDPDGWVRTGDIGEIIDGTVRIIERKNHLFKLSEGVWVSPQIIENTLRRLKGISEIAIFGDSLKDFPVAIVVPEQSFLQEIAQELNIQGDHQNLCENLTIRNLILQKLQKQSMESEFNQYEIIINLHLTPNSFASMGLLTETLKLQRHKAKSYFQNIIKALYEEVDKLADLK